MPGAPTSGAAAADALAIAARLDDVRIAAAILAGAAEKAESLITSSPHTAWAPTIPTRAWAKPALAAVQPLRAIIEGCGAFEDAIASGPETPMLDANVQATITGVAKTISAVRPVMAAVAASQASMPSRATLDAIAAIERFGAPAPVSSCPLSPEEAARDAPPPLSPADAAALARAGRDFERHRLVPLSKDELSCPAQKSSSQSP